MQVRVRLFARYRELAGRELIDLDVPPHTTAGAAFDQLAQRYPELRPMRASTLMAIDAEFVKPGVELHEGEELALMPPVSGGSC